MPYGSTFGDKYTVALEILFRALRLEIFSE